MNRRTAIGRILLAGSAVAVGYSGYKWYDWHKKPDFAFLNQHKELITALADTIIPPTNTPGAKEAGVADFIIVMVKDCIPIKSQNKFIDGLKEIESYCASTYNISYLNCTIEERNTVLLHFEKKAIQFKGIAGKIQNKLLEPPFFPTLKELTAKAYCSSELGATKGMAYLPIPGKYLGCIPLQPGQRSWATK